MIGAFLRVTLRGFSLTIRPAEQVRKPEYVVKQRPAAPAVSAGSV